jgi:hypothetical protein
MIEAYHRAFDSCISIDFFGRLGYQIRCFQTNSLASQGTLGAIRTSPHKNWKYGFSLFLWNYLGPICIMCALKSTTPCRKVQAKIMYLYEHQRLMSLSGETNLLAFNLLYLRSLYQIKDEKNKSCLPLARPYSEMAQ